MVKGSQYQRVTNLQGLQVVEMLVFNEYNLREKLSTSCSGAYTGINCLYNCVPKTDDDIELEALMDYVIALSKCAFYRGTPMKAELFGGEAS